MSDGFKTVWIEYDADDDLPSSCDGVSIDKPSYNGYNDDNKQIQFVEISALEKLREENERLKTQLNVCAESRLQSSAKYSQLADKIVRLKARNAELVEALNKMDGAEIEGQRACGYTRGYGHCYACDALKTNQGGEHS